MQEPLGLLQEALPGTMFQQYLREATASVEQELVSEDKGWINLSLGSGGGMTNAARIQAVNDSRYYYYTDPMAAQAIRLWTDYSFGTGMVWETEDKEVKEVLSKFWNSLANQAVLSARGQRKSSDKLLVDGEVFFPIFLGSGGEARIRRFDPLEITEIISNPDDLDDVRYYRRQWSDAQGMPLDDYYRSTTNKKGEPTPDSLGKIITQTEGPLVYHLTHRTLGQRGTPLSFPAHFYLKYNKKFIGSRIAIMLALTKFAWRTKIKGGQAAVDAQKAKVNVAGNPPDAGSWIWENMGSDTTPIKTETGASAAYQDGRMIKLQIAAGYGIPEQYFGDISIGNLATAKTVELPMMKMFQSNQKVWEDTYDNIDKVVLEHANIPPDKWYVDRDFPPIAPQDVEATATALQTIVNTFPQFADSKEVQQVALMALGIDDTAEVLGNLGEAVKNITDPVLLKAVRDFREAIKGNGKKE